MAVPHLWEKTGKKQEKIAKGEIIFSLDK